MEASALLQACVRMESGAKQGLFDFFKDRLMGMCLRYAKNEQQADEILAESSVLVFSTIKNIPQDVTFDNWLKTCLVRTAIVILQRNQQEYKIASTANACKVAIQQDRIMDEEIAMSMEDKDVLKAIQALSPSYRLVVNMYLLDNYSYKNIAEKLDVAEATIKMNFEKAMHQFRKNIVQLTTASHVQ
jgi:RNA polymerase sigma factor (sigma-70 family)